MRPLPKPMWVLKRPVGAPVIGLWPPLWKQTQRMCDRKACRGSQHGGEESHPHSLPLPQSIHGDKHTSPDVLLEDSTSGCWNHEMETEFLSWTLPDPSGHLSINTFFPCVNVSSLCFGCHYLHWVSSHNNEVHPRNVVWLSVPYSTTRLLLTPTSKWLGRIEPGNIYIKAP